MEAEEAGSRDREFRYTCIYAHKQYNIQKRNLNLIGTFVMKELIIWPFVHRQFEKIHRSTFQ